MSIIIPPPSDDFLSPPNPTPYLVGVLMLYNPAGNDSYDDDENDHFRIYADEETYLGRDAKRWFAFPDNARR